MGNVTFAGFLISFAAFADKGSPTVADTAKVCTYIITEKFVVRPTCRISKSMD